MVESSNDLIANLRAPWVLFAHAMRRISRSLVYHLILGLILVGYFVALMFVEFSTLRFGAPGLLFYRNIAYLNLILIAVAGTGCFSVCVTSERENGTLDLLRISNLGAMGILIGIWLPMFLATAFLLLLQIPCTCFAITLGGILPGYIRAATIASLVHLMLVSSVGFLISVFSRSSQRAVFTALVVFGALFAGPNTLEAMLNWIWPSSHKYLETSFEYLKLVSAFGSLGRIGRTAWTGPELWGTELTVQMVIAVISLVIGASNLERQAAFESVPNVSSRRLRSPYSWETGISAVFEKDFQFAGGGWWSHTIRAIAYPSLAILYAGGVGPRNWPKILEATLHMVAWDNAIVLSRLYQREIREQTWDSLRLLPYSFTELFYTKMKGALLALSPGWIWSAYASYQVLINGHLRLNFLEVFYWSSIVVFACHVSLLFSVLIPRVTWTIPMILGIIAGNLQLQLGHAVAIAISFQGNDLEMTLKMLLISLAMSAAVHGLTYWRLSDFSD